MIESPFPTYTGFCVKTRDSLDSYMLPPEEERLLSVRALDKRREEFVMGRAASNCALRQLGFQNPPPVLKGEFNEPLWPRGFIGTISHTSSIAVSAVCPTSRALGIGVDVEELHDDVDRQVYTMICTDRELEWVEAAPGEEPVRFRRIFSAKEAAYKAFFPTIKRYMDFKDAELAWDNVRSLFVGRIKSPKSYNLPFDTHFEVGSLLLDNHVFSHVLLEPR